jgi:hypothetical protein
VVENGQVKKEWTVVYTEDNDDSTSGKELKEQGYTLPEYHFVAEYNGTESGESPVLEVKGWGNRQLIDKKTGEPLANRDYVLLTPEGDFIEGVTDSKGFAKTEGIKIGYYTLIS